MDESARRDLDVDLQALSARLRDERGLADELYCALCNVEWRHTDGSLRTMSWRYAAGLVADLRDSGEIYADFYCTRACDEGTISDRVAAAMSELGWTGMPRRNTPIDLPTAG